MAQMKFTEKLKNFFSSHKQITEEFLKIFDMLIEGDIGAKTAFEITIYWKKDAVKIKYRMKRP